MAIKLLAQEDMHRWNDFVRSSPQAHCYHQGEWKAIIEKSFGKKTFYLFSEGPEGTIDGILPMVHLQSLFFGNFFVSLPYFNYGGLCARRDSVADELVSASIEVARAEKASHIEFRHKEDLLAALPSKKAKVSMYLELPSRKEELWERLPSKVRSQVRRPLKEGMYARMGTLEELDGFYRVFSRNMRDLGTPVYAKAFFRNILEAFADTSWICTVYTKEQMPVASGFLIGFRDAMEIPWASSLRSHNRFGPNMLLYWKCLEFACERGFAVFDFGRSTPGEGTYQFKKQWGAEPRQLYWHYWLKDGGPLPEINPDNPKYKRAIDMWKRLPVALTNAIGPLIVRNLP